MQHARRLARAQPKHDVSVIVRAAALPEARLVPRAIGLAREEVVDGRRHPQPVRVDAHGALAVLVVEEVAAARVARAPAVNGGSYNGGGGGCAGSGSFGSGSDSSKAALEERERVERVASCAVLVLPKLSVKDASATLNSAAAYERAASRASVMYSTLICSAAVSTPLTIDAVVTATPTAALTATALTRTAFAATRAAML
eukprot:4379847-Pleurochrysis_carterae.AAC.1